MNTCFDYLSSDLRRRKESGSKMNHRFEKDLGFLTLDYGYVAPFVNGNNGFGCAINQNFECIPDAQIVVNASLYDYESVVNVHNGVIYVGFIANCYGHFFTDGLRKLWFLKTEVAKNLILKGVELVYTSTSPLPEVAFEIFSKAVGDDVRPKYVERLTRYDMVFVPDNCFEQGAICKMYHYEWAQMIERIKDVTPRKIVNKIYLTRTGWAGHRIEVGEKGLERVFKRMGYTIVFPEKLSFAEQIMMMQSASSVVATESSASHLVLFCRPQTEVIILCKSNYRNGYQELINEYADLNVTYIEAHHSSKASKKEPWEGPFYLCVTRYLEKYIGHPIVHFPYWLKISYWEYRTRFMYRCRKRILRICSKILL